MSEVGAHTQHRAANRVTGIADVTDVTDVSDVTGAAGVAAGEPGVARWQAPPITGTAARETSGGGTQPLTAQRLAQIEDEARREGYRAGLEEGRQAGAHELAHQGRRLERLMATIDPRSNVLDDALLDQLGELVLVIARQLIRRELKREPGEIVQVIREALTVLPVSDAAIRLYLHPDDAALVRSVLRPDGMERPLHIQEELTMTPGGARIETETSLVDATVEARINAIAARILGDERGNGGGGEGD